MGSWQLEVGRMTMYVLFPIGVYYYFNYTENVQQWIIEERKKFSALDKKQYESFSEIIEQFNREKQEKQLKEMEAKYINQQI